MSFTVIVPCSARKRLPTPEFLDATTLHSGTQQEVLTEWLDRVAGADEVCTAKALYSGVGFQRAKEAAERHEAQLYICSAGLGLLKSGDLIPSYRLSADPGHNESIVSKVEGSFFAPNLWWLEVNQARNESQSPLAEAVNKSDGLVLVAMSGTYLNLVSSDLMSINDSALERVRIIGLNSTVGVPAKLLSCVMPYDKRLDHPSLGYRGPRVDFAQRALAHFIDKVIESHPHGDSQTHFKAVQSLLKDVPTEYTATTSTVTVKDTSGAGRRKSLPDEDVMTAIKQAYDEGYTGRPLKLLQQLRTNGISCAQERFMRIHNDYMQRQEEA